MRNVILRAPAHPVCGFLGTIVARPCHGRPHGSEIAAHRGDGSRGTVLECGAGGEIPPLALFAQSGFRCTGIDNNTKQLERAREFCSQQGIDLDLREADMRQLPFEDASFDYVYEHYSMCHLSKRDTAKAISEMRRVLKPGGLCFLGVISMDTWPLAPMGEEREPGEFWGAEEEDGVHSMFTDDEALALVSDWDVLAREKSIRYMGRAAARMSLDEWMELHGEAEECASVDEWRARYETRAKHVRYTHQYFILEKPA